MVSNIGKVLVKSGALKFGTFTLTSGKLSSYYVDLRIVPSIPGVFREVIHAYVSLIKKSVPLNEIDAIGGIPTAGLTYATAVSYELAKPLIYVRKEEKKHGTAKDVEGLLSPGAQVVIIDDVITTGTSVISAVNAIRNNGGIVKRAAVLIDRLEGGKENLAKVGVELVTLTSIVEITDFLYDMNIIEDSSRNAIYAQAGLSKS
jgi:orotate phosphoribosyltransferase